MSESDVTDDTETVSKRDHLFKPGQSGNPAGRPKGARVRFGEDFVKLFAEHWAKNGEGVLEKLVEKDPATYANVACKILPKIIEFDEETRDSLKNLAAGNISFNDIRKKLEEK